MSRAATMAVTVDSPTVLRRARLWVEFVLLYGASPALVAAVLQPQLADPIVRDLGITGFTFDTGLRRGIFVFPVLVGSFLALTIVLRRDRTFENKRLWNWAAFKKELPRIVVMFLFAGPLILGVTYLLAYHTALLPEEGFLRLPREIPWLLVFIAIGYPWVSAYPQEVTHRAFFFHRYAPILGTGSFAFVMNVIAFSWLHAPMWNWVALVMTIPAGVLFAWTYLRSRSALAAGFEHAIYGWWAFFAGLGYFVFTGNVDGV